MERIIGFFLISAALVYISRASLRAPRSHGFYRFFAWEFILALAVLNIPAWFRTPFAWHQLISWVLLFASFVPLILGVRALRSKGKPGTSREADPQLLGFERTSQLVTSGIYHYIRHPMYSSLLLLAWGVFFKLPEALGVLLVVAASVFLFATAKADEAECMRFFGPAYRQYMQHTKRFLPYLF